MHEGTEANLDPFELVTGAAVFPRTSAGRTGLEPAASGVTGRRYNRLNYRPNLVTGASAYRSKMHEGTEVTPDPFKLVTVTAVFPAYFCGADGTRTRGLRRDRPAL